MTAHHYEAGKQIELSEFANNGRRNMHARASSSTSPLYPSSAFGSSLSNSSSHQSGDSSPSVPSSSLASSTSHTARIHTRKHTHKHKQHVNSVLQPLSGSTKQTGARTTTPSKHVVGPVQFKPSGYHSKDTQANINADLMALEMTSGVDVLTKQDTDRIIARNILIIIVSLLALSIAISVLVIITSSSYHSRPVISQTYEPQFHVGYAQTGVNLSAANATNITDYYIHSRLTLTPHPVKSMYLSEGKYYTAAELSPLLHAKNKGIHSFSDDITLDEIIAKELANEGLTADDLDGLSYDSVDTETESHTKAGKSTLDDVSDSQTISSNPSYFGYSSIVSLNGMPTTVSHSSNCDLTITRCTNVPCSTHRVSLFKYKLTSAIDGLDIITDRVKKMKRRSQQQQSRSQPQPQPQPQQPQFSSAAVSMDPPTKMILSNTGRPIILAASTSNMLYYVYCTHTRCLRNSTVVILSASAFYPSINMINNLNQKPMIVYAEVVTKVPVLLYCWSQTCSKVTITYIKGVTVHLSSKIDMNMGADGSVTLTFFGDWIGDNVDQDSFISVNVNGVYSREAFIYLTTIGIIVDGVIGVDVDLYALDLSSLFQDVTDAELRTLMLNELRTILIQYRGMPNRANVQAQIQSTESTHSHGVRSIAQRLLIFIYCADRRCLPGRLKISMPWITSSKISDAAFINGLNVKNSDSAEDRFGLHPAFLVMYEQAQSDWDPTITFGRLVCSRPDCFKSDTDPLNGAVYTNSYFENKSTSSGKLFVKVNPYNLDVYVQFELNNEARLGRCLNRDCDRLYVSPLPSTNACTSVFCSDLTLSTIDRMPLITRTSSSGTPEVIHCGNSRCIPNITD